MSALDDLIEEIRELRKDAAAERRRNSQRMVEGTVSEVQGARVKVLIDEDGEDGAVTSPWLRMASQTGKRGGGVSSFSKYGVGDSVMILSPNGELGSMSAVVPWIDTTDDPSPGTAETDGQVIAIGNAKLEIKDGTIRLTVGSTVATFTASGLELNGAAITLTGDGLTHNSKDIGSTHKHGGVMAVGAQTSTPS